MKRWLRHRRRLARIHKRLPEGMTIADVVALNEFEYVHFQGEDGYRIYPTDGNPENAPLGFAWNDELAELLIVELWLDKRDQEQGPA